MKTSENEVVEEKKVVNDNPNFSLINFFKNEKKKTLILFLSAFLFSFATTSLLSKASIIPTGLSAISMTMSLILPVLKPFLNFIYLGLNLPLLIIFWKKIKKSYIYITLLFLVVSSILGFLIGFDFNGEAQGDSLDFYITQYVLIFCPPTDTWEQMYAKEMGINNIVSVTVQEYSEWLNEKMTPSPEVSPSFLKNVLIDTNINSALTLCVQKGWPIFVYTIAAVILSGTAGALSWKCGGSVGGTDIVVYYYSIKYKKAIGTILTLIGAIIVCVSLIVIWSLSAYGPAFIQKNINGFKSLFSLQTLASVIYIISYGKLLDLIYPKYSKVVVKIDTLNVDLIKNFFKEYNFNHPYKIHVLISGRTGKNIYSFESVVLLLEVEELVKNIKKIDPSAWVSRTSVQRIYGAFDYSKIE